MNRFFLRLAATTALVLALASTAYAQASRTWVSGTGDDSNPCSRSAPCLTFAAALLSTAAGGEISVADPGDFGPVTITQAVTINGDGTRAGIDASGQNGIIVNAGASDVVVLRNLTLGGGGTGVNGIRYLNGGHLVVEDTTIHGFAQRGIDVSLSTGGRLSVHNTTITGGTHGIYVDSAAGAVDVALDKVNIRGAGYGVDTLVGSTDIRRSVIAQSGVVGVYADGTSSVTVARSSINDNEIAVQSQLGAAVYMSDNEVFHNRNGFGCGGGLLAAANNNRKGNNVGGVAARCAPNATILIQ
jgi:hypothetical protein